MKQKRQVGILLALMVVAAMVWLGNFHSKPIVVDARLDFKDDPITNMGNPQIRMDEIERARETEYKSSGRNPFSPIPAPPPHVPHLDKKPEISGPQQPPPPPPPPPLTLGNLKFYGFGTVPNGTLRLAFFTDCDQVYVVGEGEILAKRFRVLRIGNASVEFEEVSSGRVGTAPLEEQQGCTQ